MCTTYTDEYLDHYADRFLELDLGRHGISLETYLRQPEDCERLVREGCDPLIINQALRLSRDVAAARHIAPVERLPRRDGVPVEKLRHHRHHRRHPAPVRFKGAKA